jgi:hypothetical protein
MSITDENSKEYMNSIEENKAIIRRFIDGYNNRNLMSSRS